MLSAKVAGQYPGQVPPSRIIAALTAGTFTVNTPADDGASGVQQPSHVPSCLLASPPRVTPVWAVTSPSVSAGSETQPPVGQFKTSHFEVR